MSLGVCPGVFESREDNILISMHPLHLEQKSVEIEADFYIELVNMSPRSSGWHAIELIKYHFPVIPGKIYSRCC